MKEQTALDIARRMAERGQPADAQRAYALALEKGALSPQEELEAASYLFTTQGDYRPAYTAFVSLFNRGFYQGELLELMSQAFYFPNVEQLQKQYRENCRLLERYPYCFRTDFLPFEDLPIWFFPFDDAGYLPYDPEKSRFSPYVDFNDPVIDRYFFQDLGKPVLAEDVYSQYQLEYLNDSVRKSEWVGRENHIYLHYTDWGTFCAHLQCLSLKKLLKEEKVVFLIGDEISQYPIDFQARFGIDYSQYPVKPVGVQEIHKMIWHTQLSSHNGGDFFNEILYGHPNLLTLESIMLHDTMETVKKVQKELKRGREAMSQSVTLRLLAKVPKPTEKDCLVALFLSDPKCSRHVDAASRIAPALLFQPHFSNISYSVRGSDDERSCILHSDQYDDIRFSPLFQGFKYIKTFTPMRRITTSYAATIRFMNEHGDPHDRKAIGDEVSVRLLNRSFMLDPQDRLYRDSVLVRFEDGKLNPRATFTALAAFLDLPYTQSMTYCSSREGINPESLEGNVRGFDPATVYRTYDDYADYADRAMLEYFTRDAYKEYGYDFHYYRGEPVDDKWIQEKAYGAYNLDRLMQETYEHVWYKRMCDVAERQKINLEIEENREKLKREAEERSFIAVEAARKNRIHIASTLQKGFRFVNRNGQPLKMMPLLKLDPALLEQPLYH